MSQPLYDDDLSVMEDLDPEPPARARSVRARELILGVLLLAGVLGWAGWQWWRDAAMRANYDLGQQAAVERDWDAAYSHFDAARGYRDAADRAGQVAKRIEERDESYRIAVTGTGAGKWAEGLQAARAVATIQPGYKDIDSLMFQAERGVYREALSGTVALRLEAERPGLYYHFGEGWTWLVGSDRWSQLRASTEDGIYLYDVPGPNWNLGPTPTPRRNPYDDVEAGSALLAGRKLVVARTTGDGGFNYREMTLDPAQYNSFLVNKTGVWAIRSRSYDVAIQQQILLDSSFNWTGLFTYEAYDGSSTTLSSTLVLEPNMEMAAIGFGGTRVLIAEYINQPGKLPMSNLYVSGPDGADRRVIYSTPDRLKNAFLSPDERFVIVTTLERINPISGKMTAILLDLDGVRGPFVLAENNARVSDTATANGKWTNIEESLAVGVTFLYDGYFANKLLLVTTQQSTFVTTATLKLIDPLRVEATRDAVLTYLHTSAYAALPVYEQEDGNTLLIYSVPQPFADVEGRFMTGTVTRVDYLGEGTAQGNPTLDVKSYRHTFGLPKQDGRGGMFLSDFKLIGDRLLYTTNTYFPSPGTITVYTLPFGDLGSAAADVTEVISITTTLNDPQSTSKVSWSIGRGMLAYTTEAGVLHARSYDGKIDLALEPGVRLFPFTRKYFYDFDYLR